MAKASAVLQKLTSLNEQLQSTAALRETFKTAMSTTQDPLHGLQKMEAFMRLHDRQQVKQ